MPFHHPESHVWVEVHTGLLSPGSGLTGDGVFSPANVISQFRLSTFQGRTVYRLSSELQLLYTATHWALGHRVNGSLIPLLDIIYLLAHVGGELDWDKVSGWLADRRVYTHFNVALSFLRKHDLVELPPECERTLACREGLRSVELWTSHTGSLVGTCFIGRAFVPC